MISDTFQTGLFVFGSVFYLDLGYRVASGISIWSVVFYLILSYIRRILQQRVLMTVAELGTFVWCIVLGIMILMKLGWEMYIVQPVLLLLLIESMLHMAARVIPDYSQLLGRFVGGFLFILIESGVKVSLQDILHAYGDIMRFTIDIHKNIFWGYVSLLLNPVASDH